MTLPRFRSPVALLAFVLGLAFASPAHAGRSVLEGDALRDAHEGLDHLYHGHLDEAALAFERLRARDPGSPAADFLLGGIDWHRITTGPQGFTAGGAGETRFFEHMDRAIATGEARLEQHPDDVATRFFVGGAYGYKARYLALQEKWWDAYRTGRNGVNHLERVVEDAPDLEDAYLGLGIYHYYTDVLPGVLKMLAPLVGMNGDRERGLEEIARAVKGGELVGVEGRFFLAEIYTTFEEDHWTAYGYSRSLRDEYPEHELFHWLNARVLDELNEEDLAAAEWNRLAETPRDRRTKGFLEYRLARTRLFGGDFEGAARDLEEALRYGRLGSPRMSMWGRLRLGQAFDVLGRHGEAMKQYQLAHDLDASDSARDRTGARLDAGRRDSSLVSLVELEEDAGILRGSRRGQAELIDTVEALVTEPSRGMSGTETDLYFEVLATLAEARLRRGDPAGAVAAVDRAIERRPRPDKRNRARLLGVRARALWRLGDAAGASDDLSRARSLSAGDTRDRWEQERDLLDRLVAGLPAPADSGDAELRFEVQDRGELLLEAEFPDGRRFPLRLENGTWRGSWRTGDTEPVLYRFRVDGRFPRPDLHAERVTLRGDQAWCIATPQPTQTKSSPSQ